MNKALPAFGASTDLALRSSMLEVRLDSTRLESSRTGNLCSKNRVEQEPLLDRKFRVRVEQIHLLDRCSTRNVRNARKKVIYIDLYVKVDDIKRY